jgi:protein TonB
MLESLIESRRASACTGALGGGTVSLLVHSALISGAVYATLHASEVARVDRPIVPIAYPHEKEPPPPPPPPGAPPIVNVDLRGFRILQLPTRIPTEIPAPDPTAKFDPREWTGIGLENGNPLGRDTTTAAMIGAGSVYSTDVVEERPERIAGPLPRYPEILRQAGIGGQATVECIVDSAGRAEAGSVRIVSSSNPLFDQPAREAIVASLFRPGRLAGRAVRVRVQVPLTFQVSRGSAWNP